MIPSEEQRQRFGRKCRWLDWGTFESFPNKCVLNWARMEVLMDRCAELRLNHTEFIYCLMSSCCVEMHGDYSCFDNRDKPEGKYDAEENLTSLEKEALEIAKKEYSDDSKVRFEYLKAKELYIRKKRLECDRLMKRLDELEGEVE